MSTVTSKGQVTIPKKIRDVLGVRAGSAVEFTLSKDGRVTVMSADAKRPTTRIAPRLARLRGIAKGGMSTDEIMALTRGEK